MHRAHKLAIAVCVALLSAILVGQLLIPPVIGLADTADFGRLWQWFGIDTEITAPEQRFFRYFIREWNIDLEKAESSGFLSSDLLFVSASVALNSLFSEAGRYDIRMLAAVRGAALVFASYLLLRAASRGGTAMLLYTAAALLLVVADAGYIVYFNSGFTEPGSLIFALFAIALFIRAAIGDGSRQVNTWGFVAASVLLLWSKPQNLPLAVPLAFLVWRLVDPERNAQRPAGAFVAMFIVVASVIVYRMFPPPAWYTQQIRQIAVFKSLLAASPDPVADLRWFGVHPRFAILKDRFPWDSESLSLASALQAEFHDRVTEVDLFAFYLSHADRIVPILRRSAAQALAVRVGVGHYEAATGRPPFSSDVVFALRSDFVARYGPRTLGALAAGLVLAVAAAGAVRRLSRTRSERLLCEGVVGLAACAAIQYVLVAVLQGPVSVSKGMVLFAFLYDATVICAIALAARRLYLWTRQRPS